MPAKNIVPGEYVEKNTILHKIDARIKFMILIILIVAVFLNGGFANYIILMGVAVILFILGGVKFKTFFDLLKPIILLFVLLLIVNWLILGIQGPLNSDIVNRFDPAGVVWGSNAGVFTFYSQAFYRTFFITARVYLIIVFTTALTITTKPLDLTVAISDLLFPLKYIKFPVDEIALMLAIALRFIPTLIDEADKILKAQASRGVDFGFGSIKERGKATIALTIPLFVSAFSKADDLANALDVRGYVPQQIRTRYTSFKINVFDFILFYFALGAMIYCILAGYYAFSTDGQTPLQFRNLNFIRILVNNGIFGLGSANNPAIYPTF